MELLILLAKRRGELVSREDIAAKLWGTHKPLSQTARELKVDAVVEGTVTRSPNRCALLRN